MSRAGSSRHTSPWPAAAALLSRHLRDRETAKRSSAPSRTCRLRTAKQRRGPQSRSSHQTGASGFAFRRGVLGCSVPSRGAPTRAGASCFGFRPSMSMGAPHLYSFLGPYINSCAASVSALPAVTRADRPRRGSVSRRCRRRGGRLQGASRAPPLKSVSILRRRSQAHASGG